MSLSQVKLTELVLKSFDGERVTEKNSRKMLKALWKKYWGNGLDSFREKLVLASFIHYPNYDNDSREARIKYVTAALERLGLIRRD